MCVGKQVLLHRSYQQVQRKPLVKMLTDLHLVRGCFVTLTLKLKISTDTSNKAASPMMNLLNHNNMSADCIKDPDGIDKHKLSLLLL